MKDERCPSCERLTLMDQKSYYLRLAGVMACLAIVFFPLIPFFLIVILALVIYAYRVKPGSTICAKCRYTPRV